MSDLVTRCKRRCDKENDLSISDAEWKALISEQYGDLWSTVAETGLRYFETKTTITTDGSTSYAEPTDHYATVGVDFMINTTTGLRRELDEAMAQERVKWSGLTGEARAYSLVDDRLYLYPVPPSGQTYEWLYMQQPTDLANYGDSDVVDVVTPDGEAFLIWGVAVKAHAKGESDPMLAIQEREQARVRLAEWAALRAFTQPRRRVVKWNDEDRGPYSIDAFDSADWWNR